MRVVRLCKGIYTALDGQGASKSGSRWNSVGTPIVYTSSCAALAVLEFAVHSIEYPPDLFLCLIEFPDDFEIESTEWIPELEASKRFGDDWAKSGCPVLSVPSVIVPRQYNYLLNPTIPDFDRHVKIVRKDRFVYDTRLFNLAERSQSVTGPHT